MIPRSSIRTPGDTKLLANAIADGAINPIWTANTGIDRVLARYLSTPFKQPRPVVSPELVRPVSNGRAMHYQESRSNHETQWNNPAPGVPLAIQEVARFNVPHGWQGVVRKIKISLGLTQPNGTWSGLTKFDTTVDWLNYAAGYASTTFYLRLSSYQDLGEFAIGGLQGIPYPPLSDWHGWQHTILSPEVLWLPVDGGQILRFFCAPVENSQWGGTWAALHLSFIVSGFTQTESREATHVARTGWS